MASAPLSVVILTRNEAKHIRRAIESVKPVSEDIVVMDSGSTDATRAICETMGVRFFHQDWLGYSRTKNLGNSKANHNWILSLDADEALSDDLQKEIGLLMNEGPEAVAYALDRLNHFGDKPIYFGGWNPDWQWRLFRKDIVHWDEETAVHEQVVIPENAMTERLRGRLLHFTTPDYPTYKNKMKRYAELFKERRMASGKKSSRLKAYTSAFFRLFRELFLQVGLMDGLAGFRIARAHFWYTVWKYR